MSDTTQLLKPVAVKCVSNGAYVSMVPPRFGCMHCGNEWNDTDMPPECQFPEKHTRVIPLINHNYPGYDLPKSDEEKAQFVVDKILKLEASVVELNAQLYNMAQLISKSADAMAKIQELQDEDRANVRFLLAALRQGKQE